jgi:mannose-1-phosphate guanylyltransferase
VRAIILSAGLGTRLRPLTLVRPKVLVPVMGTTVLEFWVWQLHRAGFEAVVVNAFHLSERLAEEIQSRDWPIPVEVRFEPDLLGTGGGIRNVLDFFEDAPFAVVNGDIVAMVPVGELFRQHLESGCAASLLLHDWPVFNNVAVNADGQILEFGKEAKAVGEKDPRLRLMAFTGIHFIDPKIMRGITPGQPADILTVYRQLISEGTPPRALFHSELYWREMGSLGAYQDLNREFSQKPENAVPPFPTGRRVFVDPKAAVSPSARLDGMVVVGEGSRVMDGVEMRDVILWENVVVEPNSVLRNCVVTDGVRVEGVHENQILLKD